VRKKGELKRKLGEIVNESKLCGRQENNTAAIITMILNSPRRMDAGI